MVTAAGRVVVGYDGSEQAAAALRWAAQDAASRGLRLDVVCADDPGSGPAPMNTAAWLTEQGERRARELAERGASLAAREAPGLDATGRVVAGNAVAALVAASEGAEAVVTGTRGRHRVSGALLGSVAFALSAHARCPVVVVHGDGSTGLAERPVVAGVDGSGPARLALEVAAERAAGAHVPLRVLCAWTTPRADLAASSGTDGADRGDPLAVAAREAASAVAESAAADVRRRHPELAVEAVSPVGPAGRALTAESGQAGLVVVGSRGHGGFAALLLGSVGHEVVAGARCPVMVVPHRQHGGHAA